MSLAATVLLLPGAGWAQTGAAHGPEAWLSDGLVCMVALAALLGVTLVRELRGAPRATGWALLAIFALGLGLRVVIPVETVLDVWPFNRLMTLPRLVFEGPALAALTQGGGRVFHLTEVVFGVELFMSALGPLAVFAHARPLLRDDRAALATSLVTAVLPSLIRFARSDTGFILSVVFASMSFAQVNRALRDPSPWWRAAATVALPILIVASMDTRALNALLPGLFLVQVFLLQDAEIPASRRRLVAAVIVAAAGFFLYDVFAGRYGAQVESGLRLRTLVDGVRGLFLARLNTLINPHVTPPGFTLLAALGLATLWRTGRRRLALFLVGWMLAFHVANAVVQPSTVEMQARYHLHLAVPFSMLVASALGVLERQRWAIAAAAAYALAVPWLHLGFERDVAFNDMHEFAFVRGLRGRIPAGCTVLEYTGTEPMSDYHRRFDRVGLRVAGGRVGLLWRAVSVGAMPGEAGPVRASVRALLERPPACLLYYEGLPCYGAKLPEEPIAPACAEMRRLLRLTPVASVTFANRVYDENTARGLLPSPEHPGPRVRTLTLTLSRAEAL